MKFSSSEPGDITAVFPRFYALVFPNVYRTFGDSSEHFEVYFSVRYLAVQFVSDCFGVLRLGPLLVAGRRRTETYPNCDIGIFARPALYRRFGWHDDKPILFELMSVRRCNYSIFVKPRPTLCNNRGFLSMPTHGPPCRIQTRPTARSVRPCSMARKVTLDVVWPSVRSAHRSSFC